MWEKGLNEKGRTEALMETENRNLHKCKGSGVNFKNMKKKEKRAKKSKL